MKIKITQPAMLRGEAVKVGDVVEVTEHEAFRFFQGERGEAFGGSEEPAKVETRDPKRK